MPPTDPVALTAELVRCPSVTPEEGGALRLLESVLAEAGFECTRVDRNDVPNLYARWGGKDAPRRFGFNGHTDVVPVGDAAAWTHEPFGGEEIDGEIWGRGSVDMKSAVAAFVSAAVDFVHDTPPEDGALILAITGDEEGLCQDGTLALLDWMKETGESMSVCLVGEPTCPETMGEMVKIGRRGSLNAFFTARGKQGHSAYPHKALNPLPAMARLMDRLGSHRLDDGTDHFDPSTLAIVTIDTGNTATNVIPAEARATVNIRFNDLHDGASLIRWLEEEARVVGETFGLEIEVAARVSGEAFLTPPGPLSDLVAGAVEAELGVTPELSTTGGTSDARFVKDHCPVVEFGLVGRGMHAVDERVPVEQVHQLKAVYRRVLEDYFA
ncbi:succinyl-diaminopimelate desuccinylase [Histidinibacterium aquaticum]|uniref:Succinyl-diaminopimelate desuccinylase n=1 Tax=Histidinibacterium aquaticum TaxID=2613962 RepID=A0A5J5GDM8_9RHOB|nr:succinyl-diaminopimelate desuccinylase [Histidinibacterium aquaticum]KAA9006137.1 succinyl-diaminopimelate desuccinylase [Histidinibacterium aquaticum]